MKLTKVLMMVVVAATLAFVSCKPKDADIQTKIEEAIKADPMMTGATVSVKDGVATISGQVKDDACKAYCEKTIGAIKNVKSVVNSTTVPAPVVVPAPASVTTSALAPEVEQKVKDGLKDIKEVTLAGFTDKGAIINGTVSAAQNVKIHQILASAKVLLDATSKLVVKP